MRLFLPIMTALALCCGLFAEDVRQDSPAAAIASCIPTAPFKASLMRLAFDKSAEDISKRFNDALASSPEWFQSYMADNAGVKPLPYHKNFGITEEEYNKMLKSFESRHLERIKELDVIAGQTADGMIRLECPALGKAFCGIVIDPKTGKLSTPVLAIDKMDAKRSGTMADGNPFGDWQGISWKGNEAKPEKGLFKSVSFVAGRSTNAGALFIAYRVKVMEANKIKANYESILQFELPPRK